MMLLVLDRDGYLHVFESLDAAHRDLETIDIENHEYEFCDDSGQQYLGEVIKTPGFFGRYDFRIVPDGSPDPALPLSLISRAKRLEVAKATPFKTLDDARAYFSREQT
jgi:hypothetical protein